MSRFTEILQVAPLPDGRNWVILKDFGYDVGGENSGETINVPIGFVTDFASVPRPLWWFAPKWGRYGNAAVIHDFCYWDQSYDRRKSDDVFKEGMQVLKVGRIKTWLLYYAVRYFGRMAWNANKRRKRRGVQKVLEKLPEKVSDWNAMKVLK
ncbi:MAG: DUF1353 domain-containing protein [Dehalococcoidia bacterium]